MEKKIRDILEKNGFSDIEFDHRDGSRFYFLGHTDALQEIKVEMNEAKKLFSIYDRYVEEKHYVHFGNFKIN